MCFLPLNSKLILVCSEILNCVARGGPRFAPAFGANLGTTSLITCTCVLRPIPSESVSVKHLT